MLHIVFMVLKIIGIAAGLILLLLLAAAACILFVPVRYRAEGWKRDREISVTVKINWMLRSLRAEMTFQKKERRLRIWIFGRTTEQWKKTVNRFTKKKEKKEKTTSAKERGAGEENGKTFEECPRPVREKTAPGKPEPEAKRARQTGTVTVRQEETEKQRTQQTEKTAPAKKKEPILKRIWEAAKMREKRVRQFWQSLKRRWKSGKRNLHTILEKARYYCRLYQEESTKEAMRFVKGEIVWLLRRISPRKLTGEIRFGTGDPAATGELMGILSVLLPAYAYSVELEPDFEQKILEGEIQAEGKARSCCFLAAAWRMFRKKELKRLIKRLKL